MAQEIRISREGSAQVVHTMGDLARQMSRTHSFVGWNSKMSQTDAFRGFLSLFKGSYSSAYGDVSSCLADAYRAAFDLEDAIADARRDLLRADKGVSRTHRQLEIKTEAVAPGVGGGMDIPGWGDPAKGPITGTSAVQSGLNTPEIDEAIRSSGENPPRHAAPHTPTKHSPLSPLEAVEHTTNAIHHAGENSEALDDEDEMREFLERRARERREGNR